MLSGREPAESTVAGLETYLTTVIEHGLTPSTFATRIIGSTGSDPFSAATGAVGALKGPRHGGALERVFAFLTGFEDEMDPTKYVRDRLEADGSVPGFGHVVYDARDPRATIVERAAERAGETHDTPSLLRTARRLEIAAEDCLAERYPERGLHATVDYYAAVLLTELGIPPELFAVVFATGRSPGWMGHYLEELENGTLLRPRARYIGPGERLWVSRPDRYVAGDSNLPSSDRLERGRLGSWYALGPRSTGAVVDPVRVGRTALRTRRSERGVRSRTKDDSTTTSESFGAAISRRPKPGTRCRRRVGTSSSRSSTRDCSHARDGE